MERDGAPAAGSTDADPPAAGSDDAEDDRLDAYDKTVADSFPASDPPAP